MANWHVGMQVVCVNNRCSFGLSWAPGEEIYEGLIYTIKAIRVFDDELVLDLLEVSRHDIARIIWGDDVGYGAWRFRPVRKTSIDCFLEILNKTPTEHEVAATTSEPVVASLPDHVSHERTCQFADAGHSYPLPADFLPGRHLAGRLATKLTGALPLLSQAHPSGVSTSRGSEVTTEVFADAQKVFDRSSNV